MRLGVLQGGLRGVVRGLGVGDGLGVGVGGVVLLRGLQIRGGIGGVGLRPLQVSVAVLGLAQGRISL
jgi:hypothetical protein